MLSRELGYKVIKGSTNQYKDDSPKTRKEWYMSLATTDNVLLDRYVYSHKILSTYFEDDFSLSEEDIAGIEEVLKEKAYIVHLIASTTTIMERLLKRGDDYIDLSNLNKLEKQLNHFNNEFDRLLDKSQLSKITIRTDNLTPEDIVDIIMQEVVRDASIRV